MKSSSTNRSHCKTLSPTLSLKIQIGRKVLQQGPKQCLSRKTWYKTNHFIRDMRTKLIIITKISTYIITHVLLLPISSHVLLLLIFLSRKKRACFICGKLGHFAPQCRYKVVRNGNPPKSRANLVEGDDVIVVVICQGNVVTNVNKWVVESRTTMHTCPNKR